MVRARLLWALAILALLAGCGGGDDGSSSGKHGAKPTVVWAVGDAAIDSDAARSVARLIARDHPDHLIYLGDVYPGGSAEDYKVGYDPLYGKLARVTWTTNGNHDYEDRRTGHNPYWRKKTGREPEPWFAARVGGWTILSINSEAPHRRSSRQAEWLRSELVEPTNCRIAFWHRPRYNAGPHHGDQPDMAGIWNTLRGGAVAVISGHDHNMQRLKPIDGMVQFISGAGGAERYDLNEEDDRLAFGDDENHGALRLELGEGTAEYAFIAVDGRVLDRGELRCEG